MATQTVPKARLLTLQNSQIKGLLEKVENVRAFPFLSGAAAKHKKARAGCGSCGRRKNVANQLDLEGIKTAIGQMDPTAKIKLKDMLNVEQIRVVYKNVRGQTVKVTF